MFQLVVSFIPLGVQIIVDLSINDGPPGDCGGCAVEVDVLEVKVLDVLSVVDVLYHDEEAGLE